MCIRDRYLEGYNRVLTSRDAEKYVDGEEEVVEFEMLINEMCIRDRFKGKDQRRALVP